MSCVGCVRVYDEIVQLNMLDVCGAQPVLSTCIDYLSCIPASCTCLVCLYCVPVLCSGEDGDGDGCSYPRVLLSDFLSKISWCWIHFPFAAFSSHMMDWSDGSCSGSFPVANHVLVCLAFGCHYWRRKW